MLKLNNLSAFKQKKPKRVGRGQGSGTGRTCGRGQKGQKSRSGIALKTFEGGQTPIHRRLPKRGFNNINRKDIYIYQLSHLKFLENKYKNEQDIIKILQMNGNRIKILKDIEYTPAYKYDSILFSRTIKRS